MIEIEMVTKPSFKYVVVTPFANHMSESHLMAKMFTDIRNLREHHGVDIGWICVFDPYSHDGTRRYMDGIVGRGGARSWIKFRDIKEETPLARKYIEGYLAAIMEFLPEYIIECDVGHPTLCLIQIVLRLRQFPVVYSSRVIHGGRFGYSSCTRTRLSLFGSWVARNFLGIATTDATAGFYGMETRVFLENVATHSVPKSKGHFFQTEMKFHLRGVLPFAEIPQVQVPSTTTMKKREIIEAAIMTCRLVWERILVGVDKLTCVE